MRYCVFFRWKNEDLHPYDFTMNISKGKSNFLDKINGYSKKIEIFNNNQPTFNTMDNKSVLNLLEMINTNYEFFHIYEKSLNEEDKN